MTGLSLIGTPVQPSTAPRSITVEHWGAESRTLTASGGQAALLNVHQNYNRGWVATVNGHQLKSVRLDGWQQGWVLPASVGRQVVTLQFPADGSFRLILLVGGGLAAVLVVWALLPARRRRRNRACSWRPWSRGPRFPLRISRAERIVKSDVEPTDGDVDPPRHHGPTAGSLGGVGGIERMPLCRSRACGAGRAARCRPSLGSSLEDRLSSPGWLSGPRCSPASPLPSTLPTESGHG